MSNKEFAPFIYKVKDRIKWPSKKSQKPYTALWGVCDASKVRLHYETAYIQQPVKGQLPNMHGGWHINRSKINFTSMWGRNGGSLLAMSLSNYIYFALEIYDMVKRYVTKTKKKKNKK